MTNRDPRGPGGPRTDPGRRARTESVEASPEERASARRRVLRYALLVLATLFTSTLRIPWLLLVLPVAVAAIVAGIALLRGARGTPIAVWTPLVVVGLAMTSVVTLGSVVTLASWSAVVELQDCRDRAITLGAAAQCDAEFSGRLTGWFTNGGGTA